jgi:ketosteroid isomerase-like protein
MSTSAENRSQAERTILAVIAAYARSGDALDIPLAETFWLTTDEASFIHPRGHQHGWDEIRQHFYLDTLGARFTARHLVPRDAAIHVLWADGDAAWAEFEWDFYATRRDDVSAVRTAGRESQLFWRIDGAWRLVHVHYSGRPVSGEREGF